MSLQIVRKKLSPDEVTPVGTRYNPDCNCIQQSPDGGVTWNDAPGIDPRRNPGGLFPPLVSDDPRCDAATAMSERVKIVVDAFLNTANLAGAASAIFGALISIIPGLGLLVDVILIGVGLFLALGAIEVNDAMTTETYEALKNIFYCNIGSDGQMNEAGYAGVYADVEAQLTDPAIGIIERILDIVGLVGLNNAGATTTLIGDCSGVDCGWAYEWDVDELSSWDGCFGRGTYSPGVGWTSTVGDGFVSAVPNSGNNSDLHANPNHWEVDVTASGASGNGYVGIASIGDVCTFVPLDPGYMSLDGIPTYPGYGLENGSHTYTYDDDGLHDFSGIFVDPVINDEAALLTITRVKLSGSGAQPPFSGGHSA